MALISRDVAIAASFTFIAWGLATGYVPTLRYLGYAFAIGFGCAVLSIAALVLLSSRPIQDDDSIQARAPQTAAFIDPVVWKTDTTWIARRESYQPRSLYPSSYIISDALDNLLTWLLRDFVASWYNHITGKPDFVHEVDRAIRAALINVQNRLLPLDVVDLAVSRLVPIVTDHLRVFDEAERAIRGKNLNRNVTESDELDLAIAGKYQNGKLHPAASLAYSDLKSVQQEHLREIVARLLPAILPPNLIGSRVVSVLLREILACAVMAPLMQILSDPDIWNQLMQIYVRGAEFHHRRSYTNDFRDKRCSKIEKPYENYERLWINTLHQTPKQPSLEVSPACYRTTMRGNLSVSFERSANATTSRMLVGSVAKSRAS